MSETDEQVIALGNHVESMRLYYERARENVYAEGRRQVLEEAARAAGRATIPEDCSPAEAHGRLMQAAASRDAVLALAKEPKA